MASEVLSGLAGGIWWKSGGFQLARWHGWGCGLALMRAKETMAGTVANGVHVTCRDVQSEPWLISVVAHEEGKSRLG